MVSNISEHFPRYNDYNPLDPVWCITPQTDGCFHRFFDTSAVSPSGRYVALLQLPQEHRLNEPGEAANIVLVDLHTTEERVVAQTFGWESQLGANINWVQTTTPFFTTMWILQHGKLYAYV
jgi:hypothetical protein